MFVLIFCDFCGFIPVSIAYTTLNKLLAVFLYILFAVLLKKIRVSKLDCFGYRPKHIACLTHLKLKLFIREWLFAVTVAPIKLRHF